MELTFPASSHEYFVKLNHSKVPQVDIRITHHLSNIENWSVTPSELAKLIQGVPWRKTSFLLYIKLEEGPQEERCDWKSSWRAEDNQLLCNPDLAGSFNWEGQGTAYWLTLGERGFCGQALVRPYTLRSSTADVTQLTWFHPRCVCPAQSHLQGTSHPTRVWLKA